MKNLIKNPLILLFGGLVIFFLALLIVGKIGSAWLYRHPNIILVTGGSLRPDHLSPYGYGLIETNGIGSLARDGAIFENAYCSAPDSAYGYASILTGKNGGEALSRESSGRIKLKDSCKSVSEYLSGNGYFTAAVSAADFPFQKAGFERGFDVFYSIPAEPPSAPISAGPKPDKLSDYMQKRIKLTKAALELIVGAAEKRKPVFIWLDYASPLSLYPFQENFPASENDHPYDKQILFLDGEIHKLTETLRITGLDKNTVIIFTALTGESLNEHKELTHGIFLYDSAVKIPLILRARERSKMHRLFFPVSHMDIAPTILGAANVTYTSSDMDGMDLLPFTRGKKPPTGRALYLEALAGYDKFGWSPPAAVVQDNYKYIELPDPELYDLERDGRELKNMITEHPEKAAKLKELLTSYIAEKRPELAGLLNKGADPKRTISVIAPVRLQSNAPDYLISYYEHQLSQDPGNKTFRYLLGTLYLKVNRSFMAQKYMKGLTEDYPDFAPAWEFLALLHENDGRTEEAIRCYEKAVSLDPETPVSLNNLAFHYAKQKKNLEKALEYAKKAEELVPSGDTHIIDTLVEVYSAMGNTEKTEEYRQKRDKLMSQAAVSGTYTPTNKP